MNRVKWLTVGEFSIKRLIRSMLLIPIFVYFGVFFILYFFADNIIFQPQSPSYTDTVEIVKLDVGGEKISAIHLKSQDSRYTILFNHGNAEDRDDPGDAGKAEVHGIFRVLLRLQGIRDQFGQGVGIEQLSGR